MKRAYAASQYAKPYEQYCRELYPDQAEEIFRKAEEHYNELVKNDMPDLGENIMATNMLDWFTIVSFYEASGHKLDGEALLTIKRRAVDRMKFLGKFVNGNKSKWPYKLFEKTYRNFIKMQQEHQEKGEWMDSWKVEINPDHRTDHYLAEVMHARLIRTQTEALGGDCCDYWYVGDESPVLKEYQDLEQI